MIERTIFTLALLLTTLITLILTYISWKRKSGGSATSYFAICSLTVAIYSFGYAMEIQSETLQTAMFWVRFQHWGIEFIAPAWLLFSLAISGYKKRISKIPTILLFLFAVVMLIISQTLGGWNLGHQNPRMDTSGAFPIFTYDHGVYNYIATGFYSICLGASLVVFLIMYIRSAPSFRKQAIIYLIGSLPPWIALVLYNLDITSSPLDFTPLALGVGELIFAIGFFKFGVLDIIPLARDTIFENMNDGVLILDMEDRILDFNPTLQSIFPKIEKEDVGSTITEVLSEHPLLLKLVEKNETERIEFEIGMNGNSSSYRVSQSFITNKGKLGGKIISFYEFTSEKELMNKLEKIAATDGLTGIYNRQYFDDLARKEISRMQRYGGVLSMIMLDLDNFKSINDTYGHVAGDKALIVVVNTFRNILRESDLIARYGGDEFLILVPHTEISDAKILAERLRQALEKKTIQVDGNLINVQGSFGVASTKSRSNLTPEILYSLADRAAYRAKALGGNAVCVTPVADPE